MCKPFIRMTKEDITRGDILIMHEGHERVSMWMSGAGMFLEEGANAVAFSVLVKYQGSCEAEGDGVRGELQEVRSEGP